ncbi:hypothetical protein FNF31_07679 [Cafeteria roenbergensis]|nr:hypothetical protein FNF31_07679 [Cafeteria roenbergensis]
MSASEHGHAHVARLLLDRGADLKATNQDGAAALAMAADRSEVDTVRLLLDRGADLEAKDNDGATALMGAAARGHTDVVRLLLDRGADPEIRDKAGKSALDRCRSDTCKSALLGAERLQRWRRRRLLVAWLR